MVGVRLCFYFNKTSAIGFRISGMDYKILINRNEIQLQKCQDGRSELLQDVPLEKSRNFKANLTYFWLTLDSGMLRVHTSDEVQMDRCILTEKIQIGEAPYRVFVEGTPWLELANILIWNPSLKIQAGR